MADSMDLQPIRDELAALARLRLKFGGIAAHTDRANLQELVNLRRELAAQVNRLAMVCEPLFNDGPAAIFTPVYRDRLSRMRHALALHQASWPAVSIRDDPAAYRRSAMQAREAELAFVAWMDTTLGSLERRPD